MSARNGLLRRPSRFLLFTVLLELSVIAVLAYSVIALRAGIEAAHVRDRQATAMLLATYTLRQSSDYLSRFARSYVVTGDPAWQEIYQQVLDIRRGQALRPKNYESVYWDLIEPYRSNAHPLLYPQALRNIIEGLPFTGAEMELLQQAEDNSEVLARVELDAFSALTGGDQDVAIDALFSVDYLRAKHAIMQPIDELMVRVRQRIAAEREAWLDDAEALLAVVIWASVLAAVANLLLLVLARRRYQRALGAEQQNSAAEAGSAS
jgi:hypothetical protein